MHDVGRFSSWSLPLDKYYLLWKWQLSNHDTFQPSLSVQLAHRELATRMDELRSMTPFRIAVKGSKPRESCIPCRVQATLGRIGWRRWPKHDGLSDTCACLHVRPSWKDPLLPYCYFCHVALCVSRYDTFIYQDRVTCKEKSHQTASDQKECMEYCRKICS